MLWGPSHGIRNVSVKKITDFLNLELRVRGNLYDYCPEQVGLILSNHGFTRRRNGSGMVVHFSGENTPTPAPTRAGVWPQSTEDAELRRLRRA